MGVEYRHFLVVDDPAWKPEADTAARVDAVIRRWSLVDRLWRTIDLSSDRHKPIATEPASSTIGAGVAFIYAGVSGAPVERIAGPPNHDAEVADRYTMSTSLVVDSDYRIQWSSESIYFELVRAPMIDGKPVAAHEEEEDGPLNTLYAQSFSAEGALPPQVKAHIEEYAKSNVAWSNCQGFWRGALVIDFGKDLPSFCERIHALPARDFISELADAFRGRLAEIGEFY